ncbi:hypothetical protein WICPIJ_006331 [Wickerhamomyces pijperi]|uniref:FK506-binding protein n=2 Tax=Wickerhamomyces TaxID=599737 RepID=A0A9P8Q2B7_WICPI|nr:hypothetical protein WICPIJ_006331 [Wickerhamomyces pijperi]
MSAPLASFNVKLIPNVPHPIDSDFGVKITLASVDPERMSEGSYACLRMLKDDFDEEFDEDFDSDDEEQENDDEEEEDAEEDEEEEDEDVEDDEDQEIHDEEDEDDDEEGEYVVCTLTDKQFQQSLDLFVSADKETVFLVATGEAPIYVSGYYVDTFGDDYSDEDEDDEDDSEDEYDLTPDEDEILEEGDFDIEDLEDDENVQEKIKELIAEDEKKSNKRSIADVEAEEAEAEEAEEEPKLTKKQKKAAAAAAKKEADEKAAAAKKQAEEKAAAAKKEVKFNKELEGPSKPKVTTKTLAGGVVVEDRTVGKGPAAKSGSKVGVRYIGKLKNGSIFDKNTSGKPFNFNLGKGEVIKGWDIGVVGMAVGGERRIVIPAPFAYGKKKLPGIPANSELTFDVKLVSLK